MKENELSTLAREIQANTIGSNNTTCLPAGTVVTIVAIYGDPASPEAYEVEAYDEESDSYHLATVSASYLK